MSLKLRIQGISMVLDIYVLSGYVLLRKDIVGLHLGGQCIAFNSLYIKQLIIFKTEYHLPIFE